MTYSGEVDMLREEKQVHVELYYFNSYKICIPFCPLVIL